MKFSARLPVLFLLLTLLASTFQIQAQIPTFDPYAFLHIIPNSDGSITRIKEFYPTVPPNTTSSIAFSRDVPLNPEKKTWVRVYLPHTPEPSHPLPIMVFAHGGEFILLSTATPQFDLFLANTASKLNVLVVSVEYRLAPEHRLPAAYDDVLDALFWVKEKNDEWVKSYGDVTKCILFGESAGGNIVYNVGLTASNIVNKLKPLVIRGLILIQPFFAGAQGTHFTTGGNFPLEVIDLLWNMSLPIGANKNNPYFNPMFGGGSSYLDKIRDLGWRVAIVGCDGDGLFGTQVEVFKFLKQRGLDIIENFARGYYHGVFTGDPNIALNLFDFVRSVFSSFLAY
ncbi:hypothetical protein RDABS01_013631 [Bienertia sinuspersici]